MKGIRFRVVGLKELVESVLLPPRTPVPQDASKVPNPKTKPVIIIVTY